MSAQERINVLDIEEAIAGSPGGPGSKVAHNNFGICHWNTVYCRKSQKGHQKATATAFQSKAHVVASQSS
jgi:hypothetical protein